MAYGQKRKAPEQDLNLAEDWLQIQLQRLTALRFSVLCEDLRRFALLRSTGRRLQETMAQEMAAQQTSWEDSAPGGTASPGTPDAWETTAFETDNGPDPVSIFSGQPGGQGGHDGSLVQPFPSSLEETFCSTGDSHTEPGQGSHPGTEEPASPKADGPFASSPEDLFPIPQEEAGILLDSLPQEDLFSTTLFGSFEVLAAKYLSDVTSDDLFSDIDISEFETTPAPLPNNGQPAPVHAEQDLCGNLQAEAPCFPTQDANEFGGLEYLTE